MPEQSRRQCSFFAMQQYNHKIWKYVGLLLVLLLSAQYCYGQREKNTIYLFDCTGSMKSKGLWEPAKAALYATIATQTTVPDSKFCVIPFGDDPYEYISFDSGKYNEKKGAIEGALDKYISQAKYTRISNVLKAGFERTDPNKENKIYLLTDGMPNGGDTAQNVAEVITRWCSNHRNCRLFYVALTNGVINPVIRQAIDACDDAFIIQCEGNVIPQITDISSEIYTNLEELNVAREVSFSMPGKYDIAVESDDPLFDVNVAGNSANDGKILITLTPKSGLDVEQLHQMMQGDDYSFPIKLQCTDKRYFIANPVVTINVSDQVPSQLTLAGGVDELQADGVKWYDSFLWSDAAKDVRICWDLNPVYRHELHNSSLSLKLQTADGTPEDFQAWYNGQPVKSGSILTIRPGQPAMLEIQFDHDAETGKRYFSLLPTSVSSIDVINDQPTENYTGTSLRTKYSVGWNPLKTFLTWLAIILIAGLLTWIFILRQIFYPTIKMGKITLVGPGTYYASKKIKGARKVILTSKRRSQNLLLRIFTGEVRYVRADCFTSDLSITPVGRKKKVKLRSEAKGNGGWDIYPTSIFSQYDKGSIVNRDTKEKSEIDFS